ncbi:MAG: putative caspase-like protein, partial [Gammaproteobacteria bacterium]
MISKSIESRFRRSVAIIIGIDKYENGIPPLKTAANDARRLASTLHDLHNFEVRLFLDEDASQQRLSMLLNDQLPKELGPDDRLIFYFAGHGVALDGDDGPNGYLLPQDARRGEDDSYLFMPFVHDALLSLPVRHALIIMDSCFSGAFRWAATRDLIGIPSVIHEERFDRFVKDPAWQVITSTAHDQKAMDQLSSGSLGKRPDENGHSPFALALFEALEGKGDVVPA